MNREGFFLGGGGVEQGGVEIRGLLTTLAQVSVTFMLKCDCGMSGRARVEVKTVV